MYKKNMTEKQIVEKNLFVETTQNSGWNIGTWDELLESGVINVSPEGYAEFKNDKANLELAYHAQDSYVSLLIGTKDLKDFIKFRFYFGTRLEEVLDSIIGTQNTLTRKSYLDFVKRVCELCEDVLVETGEKQLVRLSLDE